MLRTHLMLSLLIGLLITIGGCSRSHLDIFPPLEDPTLSAQKLEPEELKQDVDAFLMGALERHPALYSYANKDALDQLVTDIKAGIDQPMTRVEFFKHVSQLSHGFNDGHSFLIWPYQEYSQLKEEGHLSFPFRLSISDKGSFVRSTYHLTNSNEVENSSDLMTRVEAGTQLLAINGIPMATIVNDLQKLVGGETETLRHAFVADRFPPLLWANYGFIDDFTLSFQRGNKSFEATIKKNQLWEIVDAPGLSTNNDYELVEITPTIGLLKVGSFDVGEDSYTDFIDQSFRDIKSKGYQTLIIDIRDNTGGNTDRASYLIQHIANKDFRLGSKMIEKLNQDNRGWFDYKGEVGEIISEEWTEYLSPVDEADRFNGDVYVLIGPATYSASIVFASAVQDFEFAALVGQPTGGYANQTAQGNLFNLPTSKLRAYVATRLLVRPSGNTDVQPVIPDMLINPTLVDLQSGEDVVLNQLLKTLEKNAAVQSKTQSDMLIGNSNRQSESARSINSAW